MRQVARAENVFADHPPRTRTKASMATRGKLRGRVHLAGDRPWSQRYQRYPDVLEPPPWVSWTFSAAARAASASTSPARKQQGRAVGRSLLVARGAARRRLARRRSRACSSRFTIRYDKSIEDEQEKQWVFDELVQDGRQDPAAAAEAPAHAESISWGLKILHEVATADEAWPILADLCERNDNTTRATRRRRSSCSYYLGEHSDARAAKALVPYLTTWTKASASSPSRRSCATKMPRARASRF